MYHNQIIIISLSFIFQVVPARGSPLTSGPSTKVVGSCSGNFKSHPLVWLVDKMAPPRDFNQKCHLAGLLGLALDGSNAARVILDQPMESISHPFAFHAGSHTQVVALREKSVHFHFTPISRSILVLLVLEPQPDSRPWPLVCVAEFPGSRSSLVQHIDLEGSSTKPSNSTCWNTEGATAPQGFYWQNLSESG